MFGFLNTTAYQIKKIKEVTKSLKSGFGAGKQDQDLTENGIIQIRPTNISTDGNLKFEKNVHLPLSLLESQQDIFLEKGDVLFNNTNSQELVGKTAYFNVDGDFLFSNHITRIRVNTDKILSQYLVALFNIFHSKKIFYSICTNWNNQSGVGNELLSSLKIPLPPIEIQKQIVEKFEKTYQSKREKEVKAKVLLESIDKYLLDKLAIKPTKDFEEIKKPFYVSSRQFVGNRFDPIYYSSGLSSFLNIKEFELKRIKDVSKSLKSGFGAGKQDQDLTENGIIQIRPTNIGIDGNLKFEKNVHLPLSLLESQQDIFLEKGDVLFNNTNSQELVGKTAYFNVDGDFLFSNHITRIKVKDEIHPYYLTLILNLYQHQKIFYSICTNWNNQSGIGIDLLSSLKIPVPSIDFQEDIVSHVKTIREEAEILEKEAQTEIEQTKIEIEKMILGE